MQIIRPDISTYIGKDGYFSDVNKDRYITNLNSYIDYLEKCAREKDAFIDELQSDDTEEECDKKSKIRTRIYSYEEMTVEDYKMSREALKALDWFFHNYEPDMKIEEVDEENIKELDI